MNILIKNGLVLTREIDEDNQTRNYELKEMDVYIAAGKIVSLDEAPAHFEPEKVINAMDKLVMPGLINMHTHQYMSLFRNIANDADFQSWLYDNMVKLEDQLTPEDMYWGTMLSIMESVKSGTTCFNDMFILDDATIKAASDSGIRASLGRGLSDSAGPEAGAGKLRIMLDAIKKWNSNPLLSFTIDPHAPYSCSEEYISQCVEWAKKTGSRIHTHLSESDWEIEEIKKQKGLSPIEYMDKIGVFEVPTIAAHCVKTSEKDWKIMKEKGVSVVTNPASNMKLGNGFAPVEKMIDAGVNVTLGTDGPASNNTVNMFREMSIEALISRGIKGDSKALSTTQILDMSIANGAKALGLEDKIGDISVGKDADIIILNLKTPQFMPKNDIISSLVFSSYGAEVETTIVAGNILLDEGHFTQVDEDMIYSEVSWRIERLRTDAGI